MNRSSFSLQSFVIIVAIMLSISIVMSFDFAFAENKKLKNDNCKTKYGTYKEIDELQFKEKYRKKPDLLDCVKLYKNPDWTFSGKGKLDRYYDSLKTQSKTSEISEVKVSLLSKTLIGQKKYVFKFEACPKQSIQKPYFLIKSDVEKYIGFSETILQSNKCFMFRSEINTSSPSTIQIEYVKEPNKYENLKTKRLSLI